MGKYTVYGREVDIEIQKQLDKIIEIIVRYVNPISVILIGGFGRGEGSVIYKERRFIPINDYDIYAVTSKNYPNELIEEMCEKASLAIGKECIDFYDYTKDMEYDIEKTFYPDIRVLTLSELRRLPCFLKYFEMKNSMVIYGEDILKKIPDFNIMNVPSPEGLRFLMNRLSLMIMHMPYSALREASENDKERIINFNMKTALSCTEALLLYSRRFVASYKQRADILITSFEKDFPELHKKIPELVNIIDKYTQQKLKPDYDRLRGYIDDWFILRDYSIEILKFLLFKFTGKRAEGIEEICLVMNRAYSRIYLKEYIEVKFGFGGLFASVLVYPANFVLNLLYLKRMNEIKGKMFLGSLKHCFIPPDLKLFPATLLFISSLNRKGEISKELFNRACYYFNQVYPDNPKIYENTDWEEMRKDFGTAFNIYGFQKLI